MIREEAVRALPRIHRLFPGVFYGWVVAIGAALLSFVAVGIGFYGQAILLDGLVRERGWSLAVVSGASSMFFIVGGLLGPAIGRLVDRFGARLSIFAGIFCMAGALAWVGRVTTPGGLYAAYVLLAFGFALAGSIPNSAIITRWFIRARARAMMVSQTGVSAGGVLLVPFAAASIARWGLERTTEYLALLLVAVALPVTVWVLRSGPEAHGLEADGHAGGSTPGPSANLLGHERQYHEWSVRDAVRTRAFVWLALAFTGVLFSQMGFLIHALAFFSERLGPTQAGFAYAVLPFSSVVGRLVIGGFVADRVDKRLLCVALFVVQAAGLVLIGSTGGTVALVIVSVLFGLTIGNVFMMQSLLVSELFGIPSFGRVYGMLQLSAQLAGGLGPLAVGQLHERLGGYEPTWLLLACVSLLSALALSRVTPPSLSFGDGPRTIS